MEADRCRDLRPHFPAYALGLGETRDALRVQLHLGEGCAGCAAEVDRLMTAWFGLPLARPVAALAPADIEALAEAAMAAPQEASDGVIVFPETNERRLLWALVICSFLMVAAVALWGQRKEQELEVLRADAQAAEDQTRSVVEEFRREEERSKSLRGLLDLVTHPSTTIVELAKDGGEMMGHLFVGWQSGRILLTVDNLPPAPAETVHVAWWGRGESWQSLGVLDARIVDGGGGRVFGLPEAASRPARFVLSLESAEQPAPQPQGLILAEGLIE